MSFRTVIVSQRAKLDLKTGYVVIRTESETKKIFIDELSVLIIENPMVSLTGCLVAALNDNKVKVIFCDEKRSPCCELVSLYGSHDSSDKIRKQIKWDNNSKSFAWTEIVSEKIRKQSEHLREREHIKEAELLDSYIEQMEFADASNREGHAAKVYFNALFGMGFTRSTECVTNAALNYGYSVILSAFNREIVSQGYMAQIGLFHDNMFNHFNLSCDLMEPFRVLVDRLVYKNSFTDFRSSEKHLLADILNKKVIINNTEQYLNNAIRIYCKSVFEAIEENDVSVIRFYSLGGRGEL